MHTNLRETTTTALLLPNQEAAPEGATTLIKHCEEASMQLVLIHIFFPLNILHRSIGAADEVNPLTKQNKAGIIQEGEGVNFRLYLHLLLKQTTFYSSHIPSIISHATNNNTHANKSGFLS